MMKNSFDEKDNLSVSKQLLNDKNIVKTFFEGYTELKEARKLKKINNDEFIKGLLEILEAVSRFSRYDEAFTKEEKELQISVLKGFLESAFLFLKNHLKIQISLEEQFEDLKRKYFIGLADLNETWKGFLFIASSLSELFQSTAIPEDKKELIIPLIVAFIKYYYWYLLLKRETLEEIL